MFGIRVLKFAQVSPFVPCKTAAWFLLTLFCGFAKAATTTSTVVLISPVNVMTSISAIAPVISMAGGWITIRLSVPQLKQLSGPGSGAKEETTGKSKEPPDAVEAEKPPLEPAEVLVSEDSQSLSVPAEFTTLGLAGQPIVSLNLSKANTQLGATFVRSAVQADKPNDIKLTAAFN